MSKRVKVVVGAIAALLLAPASTASEMRETVQQPLLPVPSGDPNAIRFDRDPVLMFAHAVTPAEPFLARIGEAVEQHPAVAAAIADQQASRAVRTQVRAALLPRADAQLLYNHSLARDFGDRNAVVESLQPRTRTDLTVTGEQLLYDFGATGNRISAANDRIEAARAEVERVASDVALRAVSAWYEVLGYQTLSRLSRGLVSRDEQILADVRTRVAQGVGASGDLARAEAVLAESRAQQARFDRQLEQSRARYREAFGEDAPPLLSRPLEPSSTARSADAAQMLAGKAPAVRSARFREEAARRDYRAAKADGLPRLSAGFNGARYDVFTSRDYDVRGTVVLRQSLFAGGHQRGVITQAAELARSAGFTADRIEGENERDARAAFADVDSLVHTVADLEQGYVANRRSRDAYVEQFRVSRGSLIELLRSEQDYFQSASTYIQTCLELDVARYTLLNRTGEILPIIGVNFNTSAM